MERSECMRIFLLLVFTSGAHLSPDPVLTFGAKGGYAQLGDVQRKDGSVVYRIYEDGDLLLRNCSGSIWDWKTQVDRYDINCPYELAYLELTHLTMSHSGDYRVKRRRGESSTVEGTIYRLTVCEEGSMNYVDHPVYVREGSAVLCEFDSALGNDSSLRLYEHRDGAYSLVLDTSSSLEPLMPDLSYRLQVDTSTSRVMLTVVMYNVRRVFFLCTMWRGGQCQQVRPQRLLYTPSIIVTRERQNVTLKGTFRDFPELGYWKTPTGDVRISSNQTRPQEGMYMLNGSLSGDYSLIIPSVSQQHAGDYTCGHSPFIHEIWLFVCVDFSPVTVMFSHGESILMDAYVNNSEILNRVQWFRQKSLHPQTLIIESMDEWFTRLYGVNDVRMPEDVMGRVTVFNSSTSLNISNLTAEDSGVYTWRILAQHERKYSCHEGSIRLVYRDPFGVHGLFYRVYGPLLGCVLLGLVAPVIWLKLRGRGGTLTPGGQEMEMQDIGDEDVYDDVDSV